VAVELLNVNLVSFMLAGIILVMLEKTTAMPCIVTACEADETLAASSEGTA